MVKETYITKKGLEKLEQELDHLKNVRRKEVAARIQYAKSLGDLSENAEYADAREEQSFVEGKIVELEHTVKHAIIIEKSGKGRGGEVSVGSTVVVKNEESGDNQSYVITGSNESDPAKGKISNESPLGQAFISKKAGDKVALDVPSGDTVTYEILEVK